MSDEDDGTIDVDADPRNSDWLRVGAWDLWTRDMPPHLVATLEELRRAIGEDGQPASDRAVRRFLDLPAAEAMPKRLRDEIRRAYSRC